MNAAAGSKWADLAVRTASAVALVPLVLAVTWWGGTAFKIFALLLGAAMAYEWFKISRLLPSLLWQLLGIPYVVLSVAALIALRNDAQFGLQAVLWCMGCVWSADVLAYFSGRIVGGPKLVPMISPKKTWAGLGGAVFGSLVASIIFSLLTHRSLWPLAGFAALLGIVEQMGDIFESMFKRRFGVKDSGRIIPGHGGVLDRVDGLVAAFMAAAAIGYLHNPSSISGGLLQW